MFLRLVRSIILGLLAAAGTGVLSAVVLAIVNIYLSGHGMEWQEKNYNYGFISMSPLDIIFISSVMMVFIMVFCFSFNNRHIKIKIETRNNGLIKEPISKEEDHGE